MSDEIENDVEEKEVDPNNFPDMDKDIQPWMDGNKFNLDHIRNLVDESITEAFTEEEVLADYALSRLNYIDRVE